MHRDQAPRSDIRRINRCAADGCRDVLRSSDLELMEVCRVHADEAFHDEGITFGDARALQ